MTTTTASHDSDDGEPMEDDTTTNECALDVEIGLLAVTAQNRCEHHRRTLVRFARGYVRLCRDMYYECTLSAKAAISHVLRRLSRMRLRAGATRSWHVLGWLCRKGRQSKITITTSPSWRTTRSTDFSDAPLHMGVASLVDSREGGGASPPCRITACACGSNTATSKSHRAAHSCLDPPAISRRGNKYS